MSLLLAVAVGLAATFEVGWEASGDPDVSRGSVVVEDGSPSPGGWGKRLLGITWMSGVAAVVALFATRRNIAKPLRSLVESSRRSRSSEVEAVFNWHAKDELHELSREFDEIREGFEGTRRRLTSEADELAMALERLRHWDRLSTLSRVAGTMAHELGTPLNVIEGRATMLLAGDLTPEEIRKNAQIIAQQSTRMTAIIRNLVTFARRLPLRKVSEDLREVVRDAIYLASPIARAGKVVLSFVPGGSPVMVDSDRSRVLQIMMNLLSNGIQAMPEGGELSIELAFEERAPHDDPEGPHREYALIRVTDQGVGCESDVLARLFEPFFTTRGAEQGAGLGLAVAQGIAKDHGGWIAVRSEPGRGACFTLFLPKGKGHAE
jgi:signal transduction histidine kinase